MFSSIIILVLKCPIFIFCFQISNNLCGLAGSNQITESTYDLSVLDSNSLLFIFKHSPEVAKILNITPEFSFESAPLSERHDWMVSSVPISCESFISCIYFFFEQASCIFFSTKVTAIFYNVVVYILRSCEF